MTIELRQALNGFFARFGAFMVRRAASETIDEALDGLERIGQSAVSDRAPASRDALVGLGRSGRTRPALNAHTLEFAARDASGVARSPRRPWRSRPCGCPSHAWTGTPGRRLAAIVGAEACQGRSPRARGARRRQGLSGPRAPARRHARGSARRGRAAGHHEQLRAVLELCASRGRGGRAVRRRNERRRRRGAARGRLTPP